MAPSTLALLLRFISSLTLSVDPLEGLSAGDRRRAMDQLQEIMSESDWTIGQDVKTALRRATTLLSSTTTSLGLVDTLEALGHLNTACRLLAAASSLPRRSPALPLELISHIIDLAQHPTDFHERQQINIILSYVSRDIHRLVRPILRREVHITRAWQLQGLEKLRKEEPQRSNDVRHVSILLKPEDLRPQSEGVWHGRLLPYVTGWLTTNFDELPASETTSFHFQVCTYPLKDAPWLPLAVGDQEASINHIYESAAQAQELHIRQEDNYAADGGDFDMYYMIIALGESVRRFTFELPSPCLPWRDVYAEYGLVDGWYLTYRALEEFSAENAALLPSDLRNLLLNDPPILHTLRVTLVFPVLRHPSSTSERAAFTELFVRLAPSLRHLTLRIRNYDETPQGEDTVTDLVAAAVLALPHLRTLALGGTAVGQDLPRRFADSAIQDFTVLPCCNGLIHRGVDELTSHTDLFRGGGATARFSALKYLTVWIDEGQIPSSDLVEEGEEQGVEVRFKTAPPNWRQYYVNDE